jgi:hypothetical protein
MRYPKIEKHWPNHVHRTFTVNPLIDESRLGALIVRVTTGEETLHRDEMNQIAKELRELAEVFEQMSCPEDS